MRPSKKLLLLILSWALLAILVESSALIFSASLLAEQGAAIWALVGFALLLMCCVDVWKSQRSNHLDVRRHLPAGFSLGTENDVRIRIKNLCGYPLSAEITELVSRDISIQGLPFCETLSPQQKYELTVKVTPLARGDHEFAGLDCRVSSRLGLFEIRQRYLEPEKVKVFPNFTALSNFELLAQGHLISQIGIHVNQRRGEGLDFHQLREFRAGDALRQVDWKATSRALKPISREFQDERDQDIVFLMDTGRRMRAKDGDLSHFDHCLNAFLLTAYIALRQGDAVGLLAAGREDRWLSPVKGKPKLNVLLHGIYDLHSNTHTTDFLAASDQLLRRHRKRSLVILVSNVSEEDKQDVLAAYELLRSRHLVIIACLREESLTLNSDTPVQDFNAALRYSAARAIAEERRKMLKSLSVAGAIVIDEEPSRIHIALVNEYLALKRSGKI